MSVPVPLTNTIIFLSYRIYFLDFIKNHIFLDSWAWGRENKIWRIADSPKRDSHLVWIYFLLWIASLVTLTRNDEMVDSSLRDFHRKIEAIYFWIRGLFRQICELHRNDEVVEICEIRLTQSRIYSDLLDSLF